MRFLCLSDTSSFPVQVYNFSPVVDNGKPLHSNISSDRDKLIEFWLVWTKSSSTLAYFYRQFFVLAVDTLVQMVENYLSASFCTQ